MENNSSQAGVQGADILSKVLAGVVRYYTIYPAHPTDRTELVDFLKAAYADQFNAAEYQNTKSIIERWEWATTRNPHKEGAQSSGWICRENKSNKIVGHFGIIPISLKYKNNLYTAVWGRALVVLPEFRQLGIGPFLVASVLKETESKAIAFLIAGGNPEVYAMYKKFGFVDMGHIPLYVRINRIHHIIHSKVKVRLVSSFLSMLGDCMVKIMHMPSQIRRYVCKKRKDIVITEITCFDESFNTLWENASASFNLMVKRDSTYLNWRFVDQPYWKYKIFKASRKNNHNPVGYIVLREGESRGLRTGIISEIFAAPNDASVMLSLVNVASSYFAKRNDIALVRCTMLHKEFEHILKRCGFINIPSSSHFMFTNINQEFDRNFFANRDNWFLDYADADLDLSGQRSTLGNLGD